MTEDHFLDSNFLKMNMPTEEWIPPDLFSTILEGYTNENHEEAVQKALDKLFKPTDLETLNFEKDAENIDKAIELNEQMQNKVEHMINAIDQRLEQNVEFMKEAIHLSLVENRFTLPLRKVIPVNKEYEKVSFFDQEDLLDSKKSRPTDNSTELDEEEDADDIESDGEDDEDNAKDKADNEIVLQQKAWSRYERDRLCEGIRNEAAKTMQVEFVKKKEEWRVWDVDKMTKKQLEEFPVNLIDWHYISANYVRTRSPKECLIQWTIQEHPSINKKPWTKNESARLSQLVDEIGLFSGQWERIANELNTNRTIAQCFSHYMSQKNNKASKGLVWTPEEDKKLKDAVKVYGNCNWQSVASIMKGRTGQQCLHRWSKSVNPAIIRQWWTEEEDTLLKRAVHLYGAGNWTKVQRLVPGRTDMQCRERYMNILTPTVKNTQMTAEDTEKLIKLVEQHGRTWSAFASMFEGQTDNRLMRHYDRTMQLRKLEEESKKRAIEGTSDDRENKPPAKKRKTTKVKKKGKTAKIPKAPKTSKIPELPTRTSRSRQCKKN